MADKKDEEQKIVVDGKTLKASDLSRKARSIVGFVARIDQEIRDVRYQLDRAMLARRQALVDLNVELAKDAEAEQVKN